MSILESIILGIIQGVGEFLPISSSAHLILVPYLFNLNTGGRAFDVALHVGTLLAALAMFFKDWWILFLGAVSKIFKKENSKENKMFWNLVVATIPGALFGFLLDDFIEEKVLDKVCFIAICLGIMGILIYLGDKWADKHYKSQISFDKISLKNSLLIGLSQCLALIPGFSRSGTTILAGRLLGLSKEAVTKFTFLLSVPIVCGAAILKIFELEFTKEVIIGIFTSFVVGVFCIKFLLSYIKKHDFSIFAFYRVIFSLIILVKYFFL